MKKILTFFRSKKGLFITLGGAGACFAIGLFNNMYFGSNSYDEMFWWGKLATIGFYIFFGIMTISFAVVPVLFGIWNGLKKLFGIK